MRWSFYLLCALNIVLLVLQWSDQRDLRRHEVYVHEEGATQIRLVKYDFDIVQEGGVEAGCILLGPYDSQELVAKLQQGLNALSVSSDILKQEVEKAPAYQVYVDEFDEGLNAFSQVRVFGSKGVDSYVIASGDLKGLISVGVFKNIDSARRMRKIMLKKGYETGFAEIKRHDDEFWLQARVSYVAENKKKIGDFLRSKNASSEMRQFFCKSVASEK